MKLKSLQQFILIVSKSLNNQMQLPRPFLRLLKQRNIKPLYFCRNKSFDTHSCLVAVMSVQTLFIFFVHILPYIFAIKRVLRVIQHMLLLSLNLDCGQQFNQQITIIFNNAPAIYYLTIYMSQVRLLTDCKDQFDEVSTKGKFFLFINFAQKSMAQQSPFFVQKRNKYLLLKKRKPLKGLVTGFLTLAESFYNVKY